MKGLVAAAVLVTPGGTVPMLADNPSATVNGGANSNRQPINLDTWRICFGDAHGLTELNAPLNPSGGNAAPAIRADRRPLHPASLERHAKTAGRTKQLGKYTST